MPLLPRRGRLHPAARVRLRLQGEFIGLERTPMDRRIIVSWDESSRIFGVACSPWYHERTQQQHVSATTCSRALCVSAPAERCLISSSRLAVACALAPRYVANTHHDKQVCQMCWQIAANFGGVCPSCSLPPDAAAVRQRSVR